MELFPFSFAAHIELEVINGGVPSQELFRGEVQSLFTKFSFSVIFGKCLILIISKQLL